MSMDADDYQRACLRTFKVKDERDGALMTAIGLCGEAGEFADMIKKIQFHGHDPDPLKLQSELGDIAWYLAVACHVHCFALSEVMEANIAKLKERYPNGWSEEASRQRPAE
jgi:NTP pyrophosphatase (non-canonical NTP hydrolase)